MTFLSVRVKTATGAVDLAAAQEGHQAEVGAQEGHRAEVEAQEGHQAEVEALEGRVAVEDPADPEAFTTLLKIMMM